MKHITIEELSAMRNTEGIIIQGCGGDLNDWVEGINQLLTCEGIFKNNEIFKEVLVFEYSGLTNLLFKMDGVGLDIGKLALWRISARLMRRLPSAIMNILTRLTRSEEEIKCLMYWIY